MICRSSAIAIALSAVALVISLVAHPAPRPDPIPELCTDRADSQLRRLEEAMHFPPALSPDERAARTEIRGHLIAACVSAALHKGGKAP